MRIAIIGPGAMGLLYGAKLSTVADVVLVGATPGNIDAINENGITIKRNDIEKHFNVPAYLTGTELEPADLVILFTKAYMTEAALRQNRNLIGPDTFLMTLQNGAGHEKILSKFTDGSHVLIGTTMQGSVRENPFTIQHTGLGDTTFGNVAESFKNRELIGNVFEDAGFPCVISNDIQQVVWHKLVVNASSSVLSAVLNVPQGFIVRNDSAWKTCEKLVREVCAAAQSEGYKLDPNVQIERVKKNLLNAPKGIPSITADLRNGRKTEIDVISGAVVQTARKNGLEVPVQETMVQLVHAMEMRSKA
ncbi:MAG: ketopantoate reductase family protein [Lachnospiraceae bacterium]|nr:ketopantoate reductase family protein [Lachnospiraceae bacterium]